MFGEAWKMALALLGLVLPLNSAFTQISPSTGQGSVPKPINDQEYYKIARRTLEKLDAATDMGSVITFDTKFQPLSKSNALQG